MTILLDDIDDAALGDVTRGKSEPQHVAITALATAFDDLKRQAKAPASSSSDLMPMMMMMAMRRR